MKCMLGKDWLVSLVLDEKWEQRGLPSHSAPKYNAEAIRRFHLSPGKLLQPPLRASTGVRHKRRSLGAELNRVVFLCSSTRPESRLVTKGLWSYLGLLNGLTVTGMDSLLWRETQHPSESGELPLGQPCHYCTSTHTVPSRLQCSGQDPQQGGNISPTNAESSTNLQRWT